MKPLFVQLTLLHNKEAIWVNMCSVESLYWRGDYTKVYFSYLDEDREQSYLSVLETPEEILSLMYVKPYGVSTG